MPKPDSGRGYYKRLVSDLTAKLKDLSVIVSYTSRQMRSCPCGRGACKSTPRPQMTPAEVKSLLHDEVRHPAREGRPHLPRQAVLDLADGDAELDELLLGLVHARPLVAVLVHAGVEEAVATSAAGLELVGELSQHVVDLLTVLLDAAGVKPDDVDDALGDDVVTGVLAVLEQAGHEDAVHAIGSDDVGVGGHDNLSPHLGKRPQLTLFSLARMGDTR